MKRRNLFKTVSTASGAVGLPAVLGTIGVAVGGSAVAVGAVPLAIIGGSVAFAASTAACAIRDRQKSK